MIMAIIFVVVFSFATCCLGAIPAVCHLENEHMSNEDLAIPVLITICTRVAVIIMSIILMSTVIKIKDVTTNNTDRLIRSESVDCSDEWSRVETKPALELMEESDALIMSAFACILTTLIWIFIECFCFCFGIAFMKTAYQDFNWYLYKQEAKKFFLTYKDFN